jgi:quercetin dioxygenase-like cupin family protein
LILFAVVYGEPPFAPKHTSVGAALFPPEKIDWQDGPASLPPGAKIAVLEGNPNKEGPFVFRVKVPDGYRIPPHTHPKPERVTVISGTFHIGMGETFDTRKGETMPAGTYGTWPAGMKHYVWVKGDTVIQFHGDGPWTINYVNPNDDPRREKR